MFDTCDSRRRECLLLFFSAVCAGGFGRTPSLKRRRKWDSLDVFRKKTANLRQLQGRRTCNWRRFAWIRGFFTKYVQKIPETILDTHEASHLRSLSVFSVSEAVFKRGRSPKRRARSKDLRTVFFSVEFRVFGVFRGYPHTSKASHLRKSSSAFEPWLPTYIQKARILRTRAFFGRVLRPRPKNRKSRGHPADTERNYSENPNRTRVISPGSTITSSCVLLSPDGDTAFTEIFPAGIPEYTTGVLSPEFLP